MSAPTPWLIHIGPLRPESIAVLQRTHLPTLAITASPEALEVGDGLKQVTAMLAPQAGDATCYRYNLPGFTSLAPATGLGTLYPGLIETQRMVVETQTLSELLGQHHQGNAAISHLILEQPEQALKLLTAWQKEGLLEQLQALYVRTSGLSLFEGMPVQHELTAWCEQHGFEITQTNAEDPEFVLLGFTRNALYAPLKEAQAKAQALQQERDQARQEKTKVQEKLDQTHTWFMKRKQQAEERAEKIAELEAERDQLKKEKEQLQENLKATEDKLAETHKWFVNRKEEAVTGKKKLEELTQKLEQAQRQLEQTQKELQNEKEHNSQLSKLQERMEHLFNQQTLQLEQAANALGQHITRRSQHASEEVQNFIQVQQRLGSNTQSLQYQDQKLPAEVALQINHQLETSSYDLLLDLSAGVTTSYLASQLQRQNHKQPRLSKTTRLEADAYPIAESGELPKRILAFTHQRNVSKELNEHLQHQGHNLLVDLQFTPLVDTRLGGQDYLYYDINKHLARIGELYENRTARLLVVQALDQQPESLNPQASLPSLLQHLASHHLELVVFPLNHPKTAELQANWTHLLDQRELEYKLQEDKQNNSLILKIN